MRRIQDSALTAVEPAHIVGVTAGGDFLVEDRNGHRFGLPGALVDLARAEAHDDGHAQELARMTADLDAAAEVVGLAMEAVEAEEAAPKPKRKRRTKSQMAAAKAQ